MTDAERALRGEIIRTCLAMEARGINQGTSGNVSARWGEGILITPSGLAYATMAPEDIIFLEMDGTAHGPHNPSTEWRFHLDIMREREDVAAIVHAHPPYLTGLSILNRDIPAVHYMIAAVGGPSIRCAPYATYGTAELSRNAIDALEGRMGCILSNHGVIACGPNLPRALWLAGEMETLAQQYVIATSAGKPVVLPDAEIANVIEKFKSYGPRRKDEAKALEAEAPEAKVPEAKVPEAEPVPEPAPARAAPKRAARKSTATASTRAAASKPTRGRAGKAEAPAAGGRTASAPAAKETKAAASKGTAAKPKSRTAAPKTAATETPSVTSQGTDEAAGAAPTTRSGTASKAVRKKREARRARASTRKGG